jgi:uncharacterized protein (DUF433 family)
VGKIIMKNDKFLERIVVNPEIMLGKPCIKNTRITVELILEKLAEGESVTNLLEDYPFLTREDIKACILFAKEKISIPDAA